MIFFFKQIRRVKLLPNKQIIIGHNDTRIYDLYIKM